MAMPPKYFMYFPGNYRWFDACVTVGDEVRSHAERFAASGHTVSAAAFYLRACHYYQMGERFRTPKDKSALDAYRISVDCFHRFAALTDVRIETVEVPFEDKSLPGYFVHAQNRRSARAPCVVFFDGLDVTKEIQYLGGVPDLIKRGISVLVMDGPGTGEAIRFRGLVLRPDYEKAGSVCIDFLEKRGDVDGEKIGIVAISLGGYYAPRCAALEPLKLDGVVQKMRCPFLVVHGADDEQIPLSDAQALYDACGSLSGICSSS